MILWCLNNRGTQYEDLKLYDLALQDYQKAIELNPNNADVYFNRANTYKVLNRIDLVLQDYSQVIELNPKAYVVFKVRARIYQDQNKYDLALQDYQKAIELNSYLNDAYYNRGTKSCIMNRDYISGLELIWSCTSRISESDQVGTRPFVSCKSRSFIIFLKIYQDAQEYLQQAQNILNSQLENFSLSQEILKFVKEKITLQKEIIEKIQQLFNQIYQFNQYNTLTLQNEEIQRKTQSELAKAILQEYKMDQQEEIKNLKYLNDLLQEQLAQLNNRQDIFEIQDNNFIAQMQEDYKQSQHKQKQIYIRSFYPRLLTYIQACMLIQTDSFISLIPVVGKIIQLPLGIIGNLELIIH